jgi:hypothetical protein
MKAADWKFDRWLPDMEDNEARSRAAKAFFARPLDYVRGAEVEVHCFHAGFARGAAWGAAKAYGTPQRERDAVCFRAAASVVEALASHATPEQVATALRGMADEIAAGGNVGLAQASDPDVYEFDLVRREGPPTEAVATFFDGLPAKPAPPCSACREGDHDKNCGGPESGCGCAAANHHRVAPLKVLTPHGP